MRDRVCCEGEVGTSLSWTEADHLWTCFSANTGSAVFFILILFYCRSLPYTAAVKRRDVPVPRTLTTVVLRIATCSGDEVSH